MEGNMKKVLIYAMRGDKMCFVHALLNALDLHAAGHTAKIIFEGQSVTLPKMLAEENNALYARALKAGLVAGVCLACSKQLGVYEDNERLGLTMLNDMSGHAGIRPYVEAGYDVVVM